MVRDQIGGSEKWWVGDSGAQRARESGRGKFMGSTLEDLRIYRTAEEVCDAVWEHVIHWDRFAKETVGKQ
jgi:hypothetical protein